MSLVWVARTAFSAGQAHCITHSTNNYRQLRPVSFKTELGACCRAQYINVAISSILFVLNTLQPWAKWPRSLRRYHLSLRARERSGLSFDYCYQIVWKGRAFRKSTPTLIWRAVPEIAHARTHTKPTFSEHRSYLPSTAFPGNPSLQPFVTQGMLREFLQLANC